MVFVWQQLTATQLLYRATVHHEDRSAMFYGLSHMHKNVGRALTTDTAVPFCVTVEIRVLLAYS